MGNTEGYVVYKVNKDTTVDIFKYVYPDLRTANEIAMKNAKETGDDIFSYDVSKVYIENEKVIRGKNDFPDINKFIKPICVAIDELVGCYVFDAVFDIDKLDFSVSFECDSQKSLSILKKSISGKYEPLYYKYQITIEDFSVIQTHPIYYKLSLIKEPVRFEDFHEDMNSIVGEIRRWNSPAYDNYFNGKHN